MKAMELKGLLEEAAGTKMFENNRAKAVDVIAKKEKKVSGDMLVLTARR